MVSPMKDHWPADSVERRWQDFTGQQATLEGDGRTFSEIEAQRKQAAA